jgi:G6PDH family F420-dependent oxidoreductase
MTLIGYTMMCEQAGPKQLVHDVALAEQAGFDFAVISDHYFPWLDSQGHCPVRVERAWRGRAGDRPHSLDDVRHLPDSPNHPAVVAQKAATMQLLSDGRFTLGLGAGENLNEHIVGGQWPLAPLRHEMLAEAVEIIRALWAGGTVTYRGKHFEVESAKVWDLSDTAPPIRSGAVDRDAGPRHRDRPLARQGRHLAAVPADPCPGGRPR